MKFYISKGAKDVLFTLRNYGTSREYNGNGQGYEKPFDVHVCALAKDFEAASIKAKAITGVICEYLQDTGRAYSGVTYSSAKPVEFNLNEAVIPFGKYAGRLVLDVVVEDSKYMGWFYNNASSAAAKKINEALAMFPAFNAVVDAAEAKIDEALEGVKKIGAEGDQVEFKLLVEFATLKETGLHMIGFFDGDRRSKVEVITSDYKEMFFGSDSYGLPLIGGKAKRVKGKEISVSGTIQGITEDRTYKSRTTLVKALKLAI